MKTVAEGLGNMASRVRRGSGAVPAMGSPGPIKEATVPKMIPELLKNSIMGAKSKLFVNHTKRSSQPQSKQEWFTQFLESEDYYCDLLSLLREKYIKPLQEDSKGAKQVYFPRQDYEKLVVFFSNLEALHTLNSRFREDLKTRKADHVGEVLSQYASLFKMYGEFASDYAAADAMIAGQKESNEKLASFLDHCFEETGHSIRDLLRKPLERIEAYSEATTVLLALCPDDATLAKAKEELAITARYVHDKQVKTQRLDRFKVLQKEWSTNLLAGASKRDFIKDGDLDKFTRKSVVKCRFLLFSDVLVYGVPSVSGDKFRVKRSLPLLSMVVEDAQNKRDSKSSSGGKISSMGDDDDDEDDVSTGRNSLPNAKMADACAFFILSPEKSFKVAAESVEAKEEWITEIRTHIEQAKRDEMERLGGGLDKSLSQKLFAAELKPVWVPDVQSKACMRCHTTFTIMRRRHHCRRCGMLVCQSCSRNRMTCTVSAGKDKTKQIRVRVCDDCSTKRPSVRYSLQHQEGEISSPGAATQNDDYSSDEEKDGSSRRFSLASSLGPTEEMEVFDETTAAPPPTLICVCIQARTKEELQNEDEVELEVGDEFAAEDISDGWAVGTNLRSSKYGYAPANFMQVKETKQDLPDKYDGTTAATKSQEPPQPHHLNRKVSSGSEPLSPRVGSSGGGGHSTTKRRSTGDTSSLDGLDVKSPGHRRNRSSGADEEAKTHRRSGSSTIDSEGRRSSTQGPQHLLPFTDKRSLIMNEMVVTERSYLGSLEALLRVFVRPLVSDYKSGKPQFGGGVLAVMNEAGDGAAMSVFMSRLEHIVTLNSKLAVDLDARLTQWMTAPDEVGGDAAQCTCGDIFANYAPLFKMYDEYSSSYEFATKTLVDREKTDVKLAKFIEEQSTNNSALLKQQTLLSLLIMPIQRVPRYLMLLKEMLKHTAENHPDLRLLEKAISTIAQVASHINEHIRERENMVALREIDREFGGAEQLTDNPSRVFHYRGDVIKRSRKTDSPYHMWLFSDVLLYQKKSFGPKGVYGKPPKRIEVKTLSVIDVPDPVDGSSETPFAFELRSQSKSFRVFATDLAEKQRWIRHLQDAIEATGNKASNAKDAAPVWEQDTQTCTVCEAAFSFLFRRHHCRACGKCVCDKCSKNRMLLRNVDENKEVRVCLPCFESLSGPSNSSVKKSTLAASLSSKKLVSPAGKFVPGLGGNKRSQTEVVSPGLSPRAAIAHAAMLDHSEITKRSMEMAESRKLRGDHSPTKSRMVGARDDAGSSGSATLPGSPLTPSIPRSAPSTPLQLRSTNNKVTSPLVSKTSDMTTPQSSMGSSNRRLDMSPPLKKAPVAPLAKDDSTRSFGSARSFGSLAEGNDGFSLNHSNPKSTETSIAAVVEVTKAADTSATMEMTPERQAMSEVLQEIQREVPLEAPKPIATYELPKPLPVARIASPAQLSPISSPKLAAKPMAACAVAAIESEITDDEVEEEAFVKVESAPAPQRSATNEKREVKDNVTDTVGNKMSHSPVPPARPQQPAAAGAPPPIPKRRPSRLNVKNPNTNSYASNGDGNNHHSTGLARSESSHTATTETTAVEEDLFDML